VPREGQAGKPATTDTNLSLPQVYQTGGDSTGDFLQVNIAHPALGAGGVAQFAPHLAVNGLILIEVLEFGTGRQ
jgi:hypothetical protein